MPHACGCWDVATIGHVLEADGLDVVIPPLDEPLLVGLDSVIFFFGAGSAP
jgi:hypothetical protein